MMMMIKWDENKFHFIFSGFFLKYKHTHTSTLTFNLLQKKCVKTHCLDDIIFIWIWPPSIGLSIMEWKIFLEREREKLARNKNVNNNNNNKKRRVYFCMTFLHFLYFDSTFFLRNQFLYLIFFVHKKITFQIHITTHTRTHTHAHTNYSRVPLEQQQQQKIQISAQYLLRWWFSNLKLFNVFHSFIQSFVDYYYDYDYFCLTNWVGKKMRFCH